MLVNHMSRLTATGKLTDPRSSRVRCVAGIAVVLAVSLVTLVFSVSSAVAGVAGARWAVKSVAAPSVFSSAETGFCERGEGCDEYGVSVTNVGTRASGVPIVIRDRVPVGVVA